MYRNMPEANLTRDKMSHDLYMACRHKLLTSEVVRQYIDPDAFVVAVSSKKGNDSINKTFAEVEAAINANNLIYGVMDGELCQIVCRDSNMIIFATTNLTFAAPEERSQIINGRAFCVKNDDTFTEEDNVRSIICNSNFDEYDGGFDWLLSEWDNAVPQEDYVAFEIEVGGEEAEEE